MSSYPPMYSYHRQSDDKLREVGLKVNEVKIEIQKNIDKVIEREERIDILDKKAERLEFNSDSFLIQSKKLKRKQCIRNAKFSVCIGFIIAIIILIIVLISKA